MSEIFLTEKKFKQLSQKGQCSFNHDHKTFVLTRKAADPIQHKIALLEAQINALKKQAAQPTERKFKMSAEARQKISESRKAYWRKIHESNKNNG